MSRVVEEGNRVVFTRHALPGERVIVQLTEGTDGDRFWRGDAIEVVAASPDRVSPPCPVAGPGGCGGCDFQHVALPRQRELKAAVVVEQLRRLAGIELDLAAVEELPVPAADPAAADLVAGLRWRTRMRFATTADGRRGMHAYRSTTVVPVEDCLIAHPGARLAGTGDGAVVEEVRARAGVHRFSVAAGGFWQAHPSAPATLVDAVLEALAPRPGEHALDLYAGVGLFARYLADAVGPGGRVHAVEGDRAAAGHATANLADVPQCAVVADAVARTLDEQSLGSVDVVVLDPPREGARRDVVSRIAARSPRAVAYVACDPAALARDLAIFDEHGYRLSGLRAFDAFPMTHHVECVAVVTR